MSFREQIANLMLSDIKTSPLQNKTKILFEQETYCEQNDQKKTTNKFFRENNLFFLQKIKKQMQQQQKNYDHFD